jgi:hypothetical protein
MFEESSAAVKALRRQAETLVTETASFTVSDDDAEAGQTMRGAA